VLDSGFKGVAQYAAKKRIETGPAFVNSIYKQLPHPDYLCPEAKNHLMRSILFPLYPTLGKRNTEMIAKVLATLP
jgi:hypothetical protein